MRVTSDILTYCEAMIEVVKQFRRLDHESRLKVIDQLVKEDALIGEYPWAQLQKDWIEARKSGAAVNKIFYIKSVREVSGLGLKEAKDLVESW